MYESHWLLRAFVPGQVTFDNAMTAAEDGDYWQAAALAGAMVGEQVMTVASIGAASAISQTARTTSTATGAATSRPVLGKQEERAIRSLEKQIGTHRRKVEEFRKNPTVKKEMEGMQQEAIKRQQEGRVEILEKEIKKFEKKIEKIQKPQTCTGSRIPGNCP